MAVKTIKGSRTVLMILSAYSLTSSKEALFLNQDLLCLGLIIHGMLSRVFK